MERNNKNVAYSLSRKVSKVARNPIKHGGHIDYVLPTQHQGCLCVPGTTAVTSRSLSSSTSSLLFLLLASTLFLSLNRNRRWREKVSNSWPRGDNVLTASTFSFREMSNQICLKWNSFLNNIATSFESLWEEEGLVDVTLASDGQCLTAHKVILSASSPFFKKVFQVGFLRVCLVFPILLTFWQLSCHSVKCFVSYLNR